MQTERGPGLTHRIIVIPVRWTTNGKMHSVVNRAVYRVDELRALINRRIPLSPAHHYLYPLSFHSVILDRQNIRSPLFLSYTCIFTMRSRYIIGVPMLPLTNSSDPVRSWGLSLNPSLPSPTTPFISLLLFVTNTLNIAYQLGYSLYVYYDLVVQRNPKPVIRGFPFIRGSV